MGHEVRCPRGGLDGQTTPPGSILARTNRLYGASQRAGGWRVGSMQQCQIDRHGITAADSRQRAAVRGDGGDGLASPGYERKTMRLGCVWQVVHRARTLPSTSEKQCACVVRGSPQVAMYERCWSRVSARSCAAAVSALCPQVIATVAGFAAADEVPATPTRSSSVVTALARCRPRRDMIKAYPLRQAAECDQVRPGSVLFDAFPYISEVPY
jgi:hypothetical protein